jgi:heat shock protein HtpX
MNPYEAALSGMASTHPPTDRRIRVLRAMGGGAGYVDYAAALAKVEKGRSGLSALEAAARSGERVAAREASAEPDTTQGGIERAREVADLVDRMAGYIPFVCVCGLSIRVPPDFSHDDFRCPRCNKSSAVPHAETKTGKLPTATQGPQPDALRYERRSPAWDAFKCRCGQVIQLGPEYPLDYTVCANCNTRIEIRKHAA